MLWKGQRVREQITMKMFSFIGNEKRSRFQKNPLRTVQVACLSSITDFGGQRKSVALETIITSIDDKLNPAIPPAVFPWKIRTSPHTALAIAPIQMIASIISAINRCLAANLSSDIHVCTAAAALSRLNRSHQSPLRRALISFCWARMHWRDYLLKKKPLDCPSEPIAFAWFTGFHTSS